MDRVKVDCRGMQCPAPILEIAKAARRLAESPAVLEILADDDDFPTDVEAWCRTTRAELAEMVREPGGHRALIALNGAQVGAHAPALEARSDWGQEANHLSSASVVNGPREISQIIDTRGFVPPVPSEIEDDYALDAPLEVPPPLSSGPRMPTFEVSTPVAAPPPLATEVDLVGLRAPHPVIRLSELLVARGGQTVLVRCDDPSFMTDVVVWANSTRTQVRSISQGERGVRAELVFPAASQPSIPSNSGLPAPAMAEPSSRPLQHSLQPASAEEVVTQKNRCTLLVLRNDFESLMAAMLTANAARAQQMEVVVFFSFWGVNLLRGERPRPDAAKAPVSFFQRLMKWLMPRGPRRQRMSKMHMGGVGRGLMEHFMRKNQVLSLSELLTEAVDAEIRFMVCTMSMGIMGIQKRDLMDLPNIEYGGVTAFVEQSRDSRMSMVF